MTAPMYGPNNRRKHHMEIDMRECLKTSTDSFNWPCELTQTEGARPKHAEGWNERMERRMEPQTRSVLGYTNPPVKVEQVWSLEKRQRLQ
jgi:hypothetical protein